MDKTAKAVELIRRLTAQKDVFFFATVKEITGVTCTVMVGDFELSDVRMKATNINADDKLLITPAIDSLVMIGANGGDLRSTFILQVDDPEKILYKHKDITIDIDGSSGNININGGNLGGLIKIEELVGRLNAIEDAHNNFLTEYKGHVHSGGTANGNTGPLTPSSTQMNVDKSQRDPLEDTKVKH